MSSNLRPFHLAFPVVDLAEAKKWYTEVLCCSVGRSSKEWIDFNLFGHQIVAHLSSENNQENTNSVDGEDVPVRHFGVILTLLEWKQLKDHLFKKNIKFLIDPCIRFKGSLGEQRIMFIQDPSGNAIEFKAFKSDDMIFQSYN